jgi:putative PIN family toxin of toxin-antitoxin system
MKVFFDSNVYVAEALLGGAAEQMIAATVAARWRIYCSRYVLDETRRVLADKLKFSARLASLTQTRARRRSEVVAEPTASRHFVPRDPADSPILRAALAPGVDLIVTNDSHLLALNPYHGVRLVSMTAYFDLLAAEGLIKP